MAFSIYEPKDFIRDRPAGYNKCGGIISELLVQNLAVEGINLPDSLVQREINSYKLHTQHGNVYIVRFHLLHKRMRREPELGSTMNHFHALSSILSKFSILFRNALNSFSLHVPAKWSIPVYVLTRGFSLSLLLPG